MKYRVETIDYKTHRLSQISKEKAKHMVKETGLKGDGFVIRYEMSYVKKYHML